LSFKKQSEPGGDAVKKYKCDVCGMKVELIYYNSKCTNCGQGYYKLPVY